MKAKSFSHGIHPPEHKDLTEAKPLEAMPPPEKVCIPLHQHFGSPAKPLVQKGDEVSRGQKIGEATALFSAAVHASVSGKVTAVEGYNHPLGKPVLSIVIASDGEDRLVSGLTGTDDPLALNPEQIRNKVKEAGIVGLGGAAFPTAVKLNPPKDKPIDTVIINGCECEPLLNADYRLMMEYSDDILNGAELVRIATGAKRVLVGVEDNKKDAFALFQEKTAGSPVGVFLLKTKYPQGAEKNLIHALLRREVPKGGLPFDVGVVVQNVGTTKAIWDAVSKGLPLYQRALTVSGAGIKEPKNLMVRIGALFKDVLAFCGGYDEEANILVMGGPMMGLAQWTTEVPVIKGTSGILSWPAPSSTFEHNCILCARCVDHCPMILVPTQLMKYAKHGYFKEAESWGILDCVECGCCQYICPAKIPLVHWIRSGKHSIMIERKRASA
ncbi:MAG: electron transport complex subunit RsxC [Candidatus Aminicenantes bacterium]|jgi:electron transport complex protein RnfC